MSGKNAERTNNAAQELFRYKKSLREYAEKFGLSAEDLRNIREPVLVRETPSAKGQAGETYGQAERGSKNVKPSHQGVRNIDDLYSQAAESQEEFKTLMEDLHSELGGKLMVRRGLKKKARVT
jgi:hypothetical protein